ncbi:hypothetical protein D3OALGA1CA_698 [Olavius algarvensis associated proteobacterium Delta 3]|nr:hypothetical protein D3OALGA1CA_698 [Olavius algarvensis associated proteobacterium Delta 3]
MNLGVRAAFVISDVLAKSSSLYVRSSQGGILDWRISRTGVPAPTGSGPVINKRPI